MSDLKAPACKPWKASNTKTDIFSAILSASKEFGKDKIAIIDGDGT